MKVTVLAVGKSRDAEAELCAEYLKRLKTGVSVKEIAVAKNLSPAEMQKAESEKLLKALPPKAFAVLLDERGKDLSSRDFAARMEAWQERSSEIVFLIGGADGVSEELRKHADFTLGFGKLTWPHRLVRVMLLEQLYRAQQISAGHPYHRD